MKLTTAKELSKYEKIFQKAKRFTKLTTCNVCGFSTCNPCKKVKDVSNCVKLSLKAQNLE